MNNNNNNIIWSDVNTCNLHIYIHKYPISQGLHYMELMCYTVLILLITTSTLGFDELGRHFWGIHSDNSKGYLNF